MRFFLFFKTITHKLYSHIDFIIPFYIVLNYINTSICNKDRDFMKITIILVLKTLIIV
jgi:hypothetical protein